MTYFLIQKVIIRIKWNVSISTSQIKKIQFAKSQKHRYGMFHSSIQPITKEMKKKKQKDILTLQVIIKY